VLDKLISLIMPKRCLICKKTVAEDFFCDKCREELDFTDDYAFIPIQDIRRVVSIFFYNECAKQGILRFKHDGKGSTAKGFAYLLSKEIIKAGIEADFISAIPLHKERQKKRGFNQSELLAQELSKILNIPVSHPLEKVYKTMPQSSLNLAERSTNLKNAFCIKNNADICNKKFLLIDDVYTSGHTMGECAKELYKAGASDVYGAAAALSYANKKDEQNLDKYFLTFGKK
jgi:competence protein ComFC